MTGEATETGEAIDARAAYIKWGLGELGEQDPNKYFRIACKEFADKHQEQVKAWCGIFCLAGLHVLGLCDWQWSTRTSEPGFVWRLRSVSLPEPGDIVVFQRGADGRNLWHHAIVQDFKNGTIYTIDGNAMGPEPKTNRHREGVVTKDRKYDPSNASFFSIASLLRDP